MNPASVLVIGGGLAGYNTARELRARGYAGALSIVDPAPLPYDRPPLSKEYLLGRRGVADIELSPAAWFSEQGITLVTGSVVALDAATGTVVLENGQTLNADAVVLATGGSARRLPIPGARDPALFELRTMADADRLRVALAPGIRLAIIGAGLIGAEVASAALELGATVVLIDPIDPPLVPALGPELATRLHLMHADRGIEVLTGLPVEITAEGPVRTVHLESGRSIEADAVLVGVGIVPNTALAETAGLETDNGIIIDPHGRTSAPRVFAVGDVARIRAADGHLERRAEHWENARNAGAVTAAALLGQNPASPGAPWFWSDRHGVHVEGVGDMAAPGTSVVRSNPDGSQVVFRLAADGTMAGAASIDGGLAIRAARRIIDRRIVVAADLLADPAVDLRKLAR
ncbi:NAD(P)/FAD-dependent oxidoreductase [Paeniglutamicibacter cryotolerans]|uniref:NADPH-dependent 2,4-dienoyl-CoA reductase/sulfur reductase-like enzyme n=1 Tax=Paeniglutamicibacter cryotolerans TaxID=670079 RepID=A0A839QKT9_9MICC|nr:FAD-dependent oxidoreductase [Paeniglutamicibacter cryotolerans]MBB2994646.1 NADPH-dependent 2,4-dienoyl-CoA reductase/sulfur reductase-like enzyme [Paeniglutamicibacter cryotolerans]